MGFLGDPELVDQLAVGVRLLDRVQVRAHQLASFLRDAAIDLLVIDPFVQIHTVSENVNEEIEQVMMALRAISVTANCALHLVHHTRKPPAGTSHQAGDIFAVRGGGAIVGDAHFVFTLADMGQTDGDNLGVAEADRKKFIRLDDAKGKLRLMYEANPMAMLMEQAGGKDVVDYAFRRGLILVGVALLAASR